MSTKSRTIRLLVVLLFLIACVDASSQDTTAAGRRAKRARAADRAAALREPELQQVRVEGCTLTAPGQILGVIASRESDQTLTRVFTRYFYENLRRNPATPKPILRTLGDIQRDRQDELRYYSSKMVHADSIAVLEYLSQNGFHFAAVRTHFTRDTSSRKNVLTFYITEGPQAVIDSIAFLGLARVAPEIIQTVLDEFTIKKGAPFSERAIEAELRKMVVVMRNSGYYKARVERVGTGVSDDGKHDTVVVLFEPDNRVRIGKIVLENDENGYRAVDTSTRIRQLEIKEGQWYSEQRIAVSRGNLMSLNTFEVAAIDTIPQDSIPASVGDSTVWLRVFTKNAKPYDVGANVFVYQTAIDNYVNAGIGATAQYRNLFGVADVAGVSTQYVLQDVSRLFQGETLENESLISLSYAVPHWKRISSWRIGAQGSTYYSKRNLVSTFKLESFGISGKLPISFYTFNVFNSAELSLAFERQIPLDFRDQRQAALDDSRTAQDSQNVISTYLTFDVLDLYLKSGRGFLNFFTGVFLGGTLRGEHRDNPVDPTRGTFTSLSLEYGTGAGQFLRGQVYNTTVTSLRPRLIVATKVNLGHIFLLAFEGFTDSRNVYVPLERQFFAGGASSIRSYASRQLHDTGSGIIKGTEPGLTTIQNNIVGSATLFELGVELRYSFSRPENVGDVLASFIEKSGVTWFADFGNAFNRLTTDLYGRARLRDFLFNSVLATGFGYRFATPVGPLRVDLATSVYDPSKTHPFIANRPNALGFENLQLSIGLGHAF